MKKTIYVLLFLMNLWIVPSFATDTITSIVVDMPLRPITQTIYVAPGEKVRVAVTGGKPPFSWVANTGYIENIDTDNANYNYYTAPKIMGEDLIKIYDANNKFTEIKVYITKLFKVTPNVRYMKREETKTFRVINGVPPYTAVVSDSDGNLSPETPSEDGKFSYTAGDVADKDIIIEFSDNSGQTVQAHAYVERELDVSPNPLYVDKKGDTAEFNVYGGTGGYVVKASGGVAKVDEETGSGTYKPNREGKYTLTVTDSSGQTKEFDAIVEPMPPTILPATLNIAAGETRKFMVNSGTAPYKWTFEEADLLVAKNEDKSVVEITAPKTAGSYKVSVEDNAGKTAEATLIVKASVSSLGQAIIIAAGGAESSNTLYPYTKDYTQRFYRLLKERGFSDDDVYYISQQPPTYIDKDDGYIEDDKHDYNLSEPEQDLAAAFKQAARKLNAEQQFVFYLHSHANPDHILIKKDYELSATKLRELLDDLPSGIQQIIIIDTCYSGSFIDDLKGVANRVVITSADDHSLAWQVEHKSFSEKFLRILHSGEHLSGAFKNTKEYLMKDDNFFRNQRPWLDDDGDGEYTSRDGRLAEKIYLGKQAVHAAPPPTIHKVHPRQELAQDVNNATLWVRTTPGEYGIRKVQAIIVNPEFVAQSYQGLETDFGREQLELIYNSAEQRYETVYEGFRTAGIWRILYQAQNKQGIWSDIVQGEVQVQDSPKIASIKMQLNQSSYQITEPRHLNLQVDGQTEADLYVAIIFPEGNFITFGYPSDPSSPNEAKIYQAKVKISGQWSYPINIDLLPNIIEHGQYSACGVLVKAETAPLDMANWIDFHCAEFEVY